MWSTIGRATAQQVRVGARLPTRSTNRLAAKLALRPAPVIPSGIRVTAVFARDFASAGRPKKSSSASTSKTAAKKPAAAKDPANKAATKKTTAGKAEAPAAEGAKQGAAKKELTEQQKANRERRELLKKSLLREEPERLPAQPWILYTSQRVPEFYRENSSSKLPDVAAEVSREYKALSAAEMEKLRATCEQNKIANEIALRNWIESRPVEEIHQANLARHALRRKFNMKIKSNFDDPRMPTRPINPYAAFVKSRYHAVGVQDANNNETLIRISQEWKQLSTEERKAFQEIAAADRARYEKELEQLRK